MLSPAAGKHEDGLLVEPAGALELQQSEGVYFAITLFSGFVKFTARATVPYSALRGRLARSVRPNWLHRADFKKLIH